jgi:hypothetical protein
MDRRYALSLYHRALWWVTFKSLEPCLGLKVRQVAMIFRIDVKHNRVNLIAEAGDFSERVFALRG